MLGIKDIACYIPEKKVLNSTKKKKFSITDEFIRNRIGVERVAVKENNEESSDLCIKAFELLEKKTSFKREEIDLCVVVTQNPDSNIPHVSAIIHGKLGLALGCAAFDISLGCSGYVYSLSIVQAFMNANGFKKGLLFTSDPYSKIVDPDDKNTSLIFGDAATVTLLDDSPVFSTLDFTFGTSGESCRDLISKDGILYMNGRGIYNFASKVIPKNTYEMLKKANLSIDAIDKFIYHQGSKAMIENIGRRLKLDDSKLVYDIYDYGNTVSSSIPILLEKELQNIKSQYVLISGFGVGLSWSSSILKRN